MSTLQTHQASHQDITPPLSFADHPLTPPLTDKKPFPQAQRVITLFKLIRAGRHFGQDPWTKFQLAPREYDEIERQLGRDEELWGYVDDKIRYDYNANVNQLIVRMPTAIHEQFFGRIEYAIFRQLESIREGTGAAAAFAQEVEPARSTVIHFPADDTVRGPKSKHEPDGSFWHNKAAYPGVIFEIAYSQKKKDLGRLAEDYLLDSDANVQVVVGLDIEYGKKGSRKATLSVWRSQVFNTTSGNELRAVQEVADEAFRDDDGNPTNHPGLQLHLSDFACKGLVPNEIRDQGQDLTISAEQLCQFLTAAEIKVHQRASLIVTPLAPGIRKRKRSETPLEEVTSGDEARYVELEERATKRMADEDSDYEPH